MLYSHIGSSCPNMTVSLQPFAASHRRFPVIFRWIEVQTRRLLAWSQVCWSLRAHRDQVFHAAMAAMAAMAPAEVYAHGPGELQRAQAATERTTPLINGHQWSSMVIWEDRRVWSICRCHLVSCHGHRGVGLRRSDVWLDFVEHSAGYSIV